MAAELGLPSTNFRYPAWYRFLYWPRHREGDNYCRIHNVCRQVDRNLRLLHNKSPLKKDDDYYDDDIDDHEEEEEGDIVYPINIFFDQEKEVEEQSHNQKKNKPEEEKEKEKERVIDYSVKLVGPDHRAMKEKWTFQMGRKKYNLRQFLSSPSRDYLIEFNGDKVSIDQLSGKHVLLYFWYLSAGKLGDGIFNTDLEEVYRIYNSQGEFEVIFVALGNNKIVFHEAFSDMSWLAIPHEDEEARDLFVTKFAKPFSPFGEVILFDPDGKVRLEDSEAAFRAYRPEGYPFTKKRMAQIEREDNTLWKEISLKELSSKFQL